MSEDLISALALFGLAGGTLLLGVIYMYKQKIYFDKDENAITVIEVPFLGKLKANFPAIVFCFIGLGFGLLGYKVWENRGPTYVSFDGEVEVDGINIRDIQGVFVGVTSDPWSVTRTVRSSPVNVKIKVPDSWHSYTAYAFAFGRRPMRPDMIGLNLDNPKFKLRLGAP